MVDYKTTVPHLGGNAPIAITPFMFMENSFDIIFFINIFIRGSQPLKMIIEHGTSHLS